MLRNKSVSSILSSAHARTAPVDDVTMSQANAILKDVETEGSFPKSPFEQSFQASFVKDVIQLTPRPRRRRQRRGFIFQALLL